LHKGIILFLKGIPIGIANTVPGISGGTIALVLDIYDELIHAIKKMQLKTLIPLSLGAILGLMSFAYLITYLLNNHRDLVYSVLLGLILASAHTTIKETGKFHMVNVIMALIGFTIALVFATHTLYAVASEYAVSYMIIAVSGVIGAASMLLPGISGATILIMFGTYDIILQALTNLNLKLLITFGVSSLTGVIGLSWIMTYLLQHYRSAVMAILTGLIIGSAAAVIPSKVTVVEVIGLVLGFMAIFMFTGKRQFI